jgi:ATP-dependent helicase HepA
MQSPIPGQRWISTSEPALGLGIVLNTEHNRVELHFPAAEETRMYALDSAPLVRVRFKPGDEIADHRGQEFVVEKVEEEEGLLTYFGTGIELSEAALLDSLSFTSPEDRLLAGLCDEPRDFDLRVRTLEWNSVLRQSPARGFCGARIDLIPHQLSIVGETTRRLHPRVLLADEVGLGKTIEACLILHHLHLTGRAGRILILVPEALIHQWFVELLRRFNLLFALFDEERCAAISSHDPEANPFLDSQLILASTDFLAGSPARAKQARASGFDLLIVDEAHHLEWSPDEVSPEYAMVESLASVIPSLLLLTATPQQLGPAGHFARLRLLDPDRYGDLDSFLTEAKSYAPLARIVETLKNGDLPEGLEGFAERSPQTAVLIKSLRGGDESARQALITELVDGFGTGRVLFRNTREQLTGFPERKPTLHPMAPGESPYQWLAGLLRSLPEDEKVLLITGSPDAAITTREKLLGEMHIESALFHEDLSLIERDRNAAWFAQEDGARILISSEIGSEGRNFQFARHLVLFGLPQDPELLEQRIGRLDRIGQTGTINIHVPYGVDSPSELHARWLHEGLNAFTHPLKGATTLAEELLPELAGHLSGENAATFESFLKRSSTRAAEVAKELSTGHDRLLELSAPDPAQAEELIATIKGQDEDPKFEKFVVRLFDRLGLDVSDLSLRSYHLKRGQRLSEAFADLPEDGLSVTFDREESLAREDLAQISMDHPMVRGAIDHLLTSENGNASFARWETSQGRAIFLEACYVLETLAPERLHIERFLPPSMLRILVDHRGTDLSSSKVNMQLQKGDARRLVTQPAFRSDILPKLLHSAKGYADEASKPLLARARKSAKASFKVEIDRLNDLAQRNPQVSPEEIRALEGMRDDSLAALKTARLRLDCIRVIWRT